MILLPVVILCLRSASCWEYGPPQFRHQTRSQNQYPHAVPMDRLAPPPLDRETLDQAEDISSFPYAASSGCKNTDLEANKKVGMGFYQDVWGNKQFDLVNKYLAENVINHNPHEVNGRESVLEMLRGPMGDGPPVKVQFQRVSAEGDLVWIHNRLPIPATNKTYAIVDIFRIDCDGMIAEKWDVMQDTDVPTRNPAPFF